MSLSVRVWLLAVSLLAPAASAAVHEARVGLHRRVDLSCIAQSNVVCALNKACGEGARVELRGDALVVRVDPQKLPRDFDSLRAAARVFTSAAAPDATAAQRRMHGLFLPRDVDPQRPMVVLIHGLDCNRSNWTPMADLLIGRGFQAAYFAYPSDQPLAESAKLLSENMTALRQTFADVPLHIIAHSMGGLVARAYVEGDTYGGGVERLILLGPPNLGTRWATYRIALEVQEHYSLWRHEPNWRPSWMITDGLGEAGRDLKPASRFLASLNERPRRAGVKYTIIAGSQHPIAPMTANAIEGAANIVPDRATKWWGFRQTDAALHRAADRLRHRAGKSDGPVRVSSTMLRGVDDHVTVACDHASLYYPHEGKAPAAWDVIRDRLSR